LGNRTRVSGRPSRGFYRLYPERVDHLVLADTYAGWKGSLPEDVVDKRRARCYRDAFRPNDEVVSEWVPTEFFSNVTQELAREMAEVVADFHPRGFKLMAKALADTDTSSVLRTIYRAATTSRFLTLTTCSGTGSGGIGTNCDFRTWWAGPGRPTHHIGKRERRGWSRALSIRSTSGHYVSFPMPLAGVTTSVSGGTRRVSPPTPPADRVG
jgi:hypothetical protein